MPDMPKDIRTRFQGVYARHQQRCRVHDGGRCNCKPSYYGVAYDRVQRKPVRTRRHPTVDGAKNARSDLQATLDRGEAPAARGPRLTEARTHFVTAAREGRALNKHGRRYKTTAIDVIEGRLKHDIEPRLGRRTDHRYTPRRSPGDHRRARSGRQRLERPRSREQSEGALHVGRGSRLGQPQPRRARKAAGDERQPDRAGRLASRVRPAARRSGHGGRARVRARWLRDGPCRTDPARPLARRRSQRRRGRARRRRRTRASPPPPAGSSRRSRPCTRC